MSEEKTKGQQLQELLFNKRENGVDFMDDAELGVCDDFCEGYKQFLDEAKTEREAVTRIVELAQQARGRCPSTGPGAGCRVPAL